MLVLLHAGLGFPGSARRRLPARAAVLGTNRDRSCVVRFGARWGKITLEWSPFPLEAQTLNIFSADNFNSQFTRLGASTLRFRRQDDAPAMPTTAREQTTASAAQCLGPRRSGAHSDKQTSVHAQRRHGPYPAGAGRPQR